jgi:tetratricopeptide (TPR) repeat protein
MSKHWKLSPSVWILASLLVIVALVVLWLGFSNHLRNSDLVSRARTAYIAGDWNRAAVLARSQLKAEPTDREALRLLARANARLGRDSAANALFARLGSAALQSEDLYLLGLGLSRSAQTAEAARVWERALALEANRPEALEQLASLYSTQNRLAEAAILAERLSRQPGWQLKGELALGALRSELNDPAGAATAFRQALDRPESSQLPGDLTSRYRKLLVRCLLQTAKPDEARAELKKQLESKADEEASWLLSRAELALGAVGPASEALAKSGDYRRLHPLEPEPGPFAGEQRCAPCHSEIFEAQQASRHSSTLLWGHGLTNLPLPEHPITDPDDPKVSHVFRRDGDTIRYETHTETEVRKAVVEYAFGSLDHYASLVGSDNRGRPHILRLSHYHSGSDSGWVRTTGHSADAGGGRDLLGKQLDPADGVHKCLFCHATSPTAILSKSGPASSDRGIGCERCHGPAALHLKAVVAKFPDLAIVNPKNATAEARLRICAQCHAYHQDLSLPRTDQFWIRFQGTTFPWSRCYTESASAFDCITCHDPHKGSESRAEDYASRCLKCHQASTTRPAAASGSAAPATSRRTAVCPVSPTTGCVACHMPPFRSEPIHATFTDHYIRIHPELKAQSLK